MAYTVMKGRLSKAVFYLLVGLGMVSALEIHFKRAPRGVRMTSPLSGSRYALGSTNSNGTVGSIKDARVVCARKRNSMSQTLQLMGSVRLSAFSKTHAGVISDSNKEVQVALDTGSTDLWVNPQGGIGSFNDTKIPLQLNYGDGTYGVKGTIGVAPFTFGSYHVNRQAFLHVDSSTVLGLAENGIYGLMGLSFDFTSASPINLAIKRIYSADAHWGRSVLRNIFAQNETQPNFIGINLARTGDLEDTLGGSFTIGEYDSRFADVAQAKKLEQDPKGGDRWTTLLDGISVDGKSVEMASTIPGVPKGKSRALLDTGDPTSMFPIDIVDGIYSKIPGSALYDDPFTKVRVWIIPCNSTALVEFFFSEQKYAIHPLDLSIISEAIKIRGKEYTACVSSFVGVDNWTNGAFDISLGATFLRNVYSVFDFGDNHRPNGTIGEPYIQLLSKTDPVKANAQVVSTRGDTMATLPPELEPSVLVAALLSRQDPTVTAPSDDNDMLDRSKSPEPGRLSETSSFGRYTSIIIALLVFNLLLTMTLVGFSVMMWIRRGHSTRRKPREIDPLYTPPMTSAEGYHHFHERHSSVYSRPYNQVLFQADSLAG